MVKLVFCLLTFQQVEIGSFVNITFRSPVLFFPEQRRVITSATILIPSIDMISLS